MNEEQIIRAIQSGNDRQSNAGVSCFFEQQKFQNGLKKLIGNEDDFKDIFLETKSIVYQKIRDRKYQHKDNLDGYFYIIGRNIWLKKNKKKLDISFDDALLPTILTSKQEEEIAFVMEKFNQLGEICRKIIWMHEVEGKPQKKIAEEIKYTSYDALRKKYGKCWKKLLDLFKSK